MPPHAERGRPATRSRPLAIIPHAVWLNRRFALSYRDDEDLLAERGIDASCETVRPWALKLGRAIAARIRQSRAKSFADWRQIVAA